MIYDDTDSDRIVVSHDPVESARMMVKIRADRPGLDNDLYSYGVLLDNRTVTAVLSIDDLRSLVALADKARAADLAQYAEDREEGGGVDTPKTPARKTGWRWIAPTGECVTLSPTWLWIWRSEALTGREEGLVAGGWRVGSTLRTPEDVAAWFAAWEADGRPSG